MIKVLQMYCKVGNNPTSSISFTDLDKIILWHIPPKLVIVYA